MTGQAGNIDLERLDAQMTELLEYVYSFHNKEIKTLAVQEYFPVASAKLHPA